MPPQIKVSKAEATWQRQRGGRGGFAGRGPGRTLTTFGGGAGDVPGGYGPSGGRRVWGGSGSIAGRGGAGGGAATKRLVKAGGAAVKAEPKDESMEDKESMEGVEAAAEELEELEFEDDPLSYDQYYPAMLPHRWTGWISGRGPGCRMGGSLGGALEYGGGGGWQALLVGWQGSAGCCWLHGSKLLLSVMLARPHQCAEGGLVKPLGAVGPLPCVGMAQHQSPAHLLPPCCREEGEPLVKEPDDPAAVIPKDLFDLPVSAAFLVCTRVSLQQSFGERADHPVTSAVMHALAEVPPARFGTQRTGGWAAWWAACRTTGMQHPPSCCSGATLPSAFRQTNPLPSPGLSSTGGLPASDRGDVLPAGRGAERRPPDAVPAARPAAGGPAGEIASAGRVLPVVAKCWLGVWRCRFVRSQMAARQARAVACRPLFPAAPHPPLALPTPVPHTGTRGKWRGPVSGCLPSCQPKGGAQ